MAQRWWPDGLPSDSDGDGDGEPGTKRPRTQCGLPDIPSDDDCTSADAPGLSAGVPGTSAGALGSSAVVPAHSAGAAGRRRSPKAQIDPKWRDDATSVDAAMVEWLRTHEIAWAAAVGEVLGAKLARIKPPQVATDCEGIGAPSEALRIMELARVIGGYHHVMSCEIDDVARTWFLRHHRWPDHLFQNMLDRTWPEGASPDLLSSGVTVLQGIDCDLYVCGFPCQPFSSRHVRSTVFDEAKVTSLAVIV